MQCMAAGDGLPPPRGGKFRLDGPGGPGIEFQPTHGCACYFNTAELYHGTDALEDCECSYHSGAHAMDTHMLCLLCLNTHFSCCNHAGEGCQIQIGTALVLKKATQMTAANQAAENEVFMAAANKVKRQEKEAKMAGEWAALHGPRLSASVLLTPLPYTDKTLRYREMLAAC